MLRNHIHHRSASQLALANSISTSRTYLSQHLSQPTYSYIRMGWPGNWDNRVALQRKRGPLPMIAARPPACLPAT